MQWLGNNACFYCIGSLYHRVDTLVRSCGLRNDITHKAYENNREYKLNEITVKGSKVAERHGIRDNKMTAQGQNGQRCYIGRERNNRDKARKKADYTQAKIPRLCIGLQKFIKLQLLRIDYPDQG